MCVLNYIVLISSFSLPIITHKLPNIQLPLFLSLSPSTQSLHKGRTTFTSKRFSLETLENQLKGFQAHPFELRQLAVLYIFLCMGCIISKAEPEHFCRGSDGSTCARVTKKPCDGEVGFRLPEFSASTEKGLPDWLVSAAGDFIGDLIMWSADNFVKLEKIGQGTYSNVYKAKNKVTGEVVAMKKVRFDASDPSSVEFMIREIRVLKKLNHPNVIKLEGLATSRMSSGLYLVFEYMDHDLTGLTGHQGVRFTEPQVKCYMKQLLSGLEHCHNNGILHRDIKCSNLLINNEGILKIADFGLAAFFDPVHRKPMTSTVVTLWYRAPELLFGTEYYGVGVDLWSAGCILAELLSGIPTFPGRTEVEQIHMIFKLCGTPSEECWAKLQAKNASIFKAKQQYKRCILETFKDFPSSSLTLVDTLLSMDPHKRGTATDALNNEFFTSEPFACQPSSMPKYTPSKEMDFKLRAEKTRRGTKGKADSGNSIRKVRARNHTGRAMPAPQANAEIQSNLDRLRILAEAQAKSKSEKFPPPHQDGTVGHSTDSSNTSFDALDKTFTTSNGKLRFPVFARKIQSTIF